MIEPSVSLSGHLCAAANSICEFGVLSRSDRSHDWTPSPVFGTNLNERRKVRQCKTGMRCGQRGSNGHPRGSWAIEGTVPSIVASGRARSVASVGIARNSPWSIRMSGSPKISALRSQFDEITRVHDGDAVGNVRDHSQIVRYEEHRQSKFMPQIGKQVEDLLLDRDVKRGGGFVRNAEQLRTVDDGHRDHDALPHAYPKAGADNCVRVVRDREWQRRACRRPLVPRLLLWKRDGERARLRRSVRRPA